MDDRKILKLKEMIEQLHQDGVDHEKIKEQFKTEFGTISGEELAAAERKLVEAGEIDVQQIQKLCSIHASVFEGNIEDIHAKDIETTVGHPAFVFLKENEGLEAFLTGSFAKAKDAYLASKTDDTKANLLAALKELSKLDRHYSRKENLFFPYMEKAGITAPPKVMWGVDDEIRERWKSAIRTLDEGNEVSKDHLDELVSEVQGMIGKENNILMPMLKGCMDSEAWLTVGRDSAEIGFCFNDGIEGASASDAVTWYRWNASLSDKSDELSIDEKKGLVNLPSGNMTLEELTWLFNSLPMDITFVGADDRVRFFSETPDRIFPRTRSIVGREVALCHPPKSLDVVEQLVADFKSGKKDTESYWLQKGTQFILIRYFAVRDENGKYLGVAETTEEISALRKLEGQKLLLS